MTRQKCSRGIIVDYDACDSSVPPSQSGLKAPSELYQIDQDMYYACTYYELHDALNDITNNKGLPRVHDTSQQGLYGCDSLYKISEMGNDADMIADQIPRLLFLKQLLEKYPERRIAGYDYSALDEIEKWKSVSEPYWISDDFVRIDHEGQNLVAGKEYYGWIKEFNSSGTSITSTTPEGYIDQWKTYGGEPIAGKTITVELSDLNHAVIYDSVTRTIPEPVVPSWKSVGNPYWVDDETVRIDCEGQNLVAGVYYYCEGFIETGCDIPLHATGIEITSTNPIGHVQFKQLVQSYGCVLPVDAIIKLYDSAEAVYYNPITRTIPEPTIPDDGSKQDFINELAARGRIPIETLPYGQPSGGGWSDLYNTDQYAMYSGKTCNGKTFTIVIRLKHWATPNCSGNNPPTEANCIAWTYDETYSGYGTEGSAPAACARAALDELYAPLVCLEGERECKGVGLYECRQNRWVLIEEKSEQCGYVPSEKCDTLIVEEPPS